MRQQLRKKFEDGELIMYNSKVAPELQENKYSFIPPLSA